MRERFEDFVDDLEKGPRDIDWKSGIGGMVLGSQNGMVSF